MSNATQQQMIYDLIDGQLSADQVEQAQQLIAENVELAELYESLRDQQSALRAMPKYELDSGFASRVIRAAQAEGLLDEDSTPSPNTVKYSRPVDMRNWWAPASAIAALAAMLLVTLFVIPNLPSPTSIAQNNTPEANLAEEEAKDDQIADSSEADTEQSDGANPESIQSIANAQNNNTPRIKEPGNARRGSDPPTAAMNNAVEADSTNDQIASNNVEKGLQADPNRGVMNPMHERSAQPSRMMMAKSKVPQNQVLVFKVSEKEAAIRELNKAFSENGIIVGLPETASQRMSRFRDSESATDQGDGIEQREFAYHVRTTPDQMQKAILALQSQTQIVAVDSINNSAMEKANGAQPMMMAQQAMADAGPEGQAKGQELRTQNFGSAKMRGAKPEESGGAGGSAEIESVPDDGSPEFQAAEMMALKDTMNQDELRNINQYFGLASDVDEADLIPQSYTLIFMLDDAVAESAAGDPIEADAAPNKIDQRP